MRKIRISTARKIKVARSISRHTVITVIRIIIHHPVSITTIVIFGDSIPKGINIRNLNTRLSTANCKCPFGSFGVATSKHFHHYIQTTLNETNGKTDTAVLHMGTNYILNTFSTNVPLFFSTLMIIHIH